jgi:hypothetical protein
LSRQEWSLLTAVASIFPLVPSDHHRFTRETKDGAIPVDATLLREALRTHTQELKRRVREWIRPAHPPAPRGEVILRLSPTDLEHWLQVLNDVRVGSWIRLGCPDPKTSGAIDPSPAHQRHLFLMDFCGMVQARLLEALDEPDDPPPD